MFDYCIVGGGILGLATAMSLLDRRPGASVVVIEKETGVARHQTGHNSGVIHSGIYYQPGSLKAELCRRGEQATKDFCQTHSIPVAVTGKLLVATDARESGLMSDLEARARHNRIDAARLSASELRDVEPNIKGTGALYIPKTGIVDYAQVSEAMANVVRAAGGAIELGVEVSGILESPGSVSVTARAGEDSQRSWTARQVIVCAGLQADRLARIAGVQSDVRIVPFRGEYYRLPASRDDIVRHLIYPVPNPNVPFLGVHLTLMIDGRITVGPNAVLGLAREGYRKLSFSRRDAADILTFPGFWRFARGHIKIGAVELRNSFIKHYYLEAVRKYCPDLGLADLLPETAGIRAQAMRREGTLVDDFLFVQTDRMLHVINAPSPAATSAIPIGATIAARCVGTTTT